MFGFYIRNNIGVAFQCFAGGLFAGVGSLFFLAYNGAFGGALAGYLTERGLSSTFYLVRRDALGVRADGDRAVRRGRAEHRPRAARAGPPDAACSRSCMATRDARSCCTASPRCCSSPPPSRRSGRRRRWLPRRRQIRRRRGLLDRGVRLFRVPGPPCRLTRSRCGCGRARRSKPPTSACACARAPRAIRLSPATALVALPVTALAIASYEIAGWLPALRDLVREAVARSHDPVRAVARRVRPAHHTVRCVARTAAGVVEPVAVHVDRAAAVAVAIAHAAGLPARGPLDSGRAGARVRQIRRRTHGHRR